MVKKVWSPFERGMFCNDKSISYPFTDHETVSDTVLLLFGVAMPAVLVSWEDIPHSIQYQAHPGFGCFLGKLVNQSATLVHWYHHPVVLCLLAGHAC